MTKTVYLVMLGVYDEGIISSSIRVFDDEKAAAQCKQLQQSRIDAREIYGVDYVMKLERKVAGKPPSSKDLAQSVY